MKLSWYNIQVVYFTDYLIDEFCSTIFVKDYHILQTYQYFTLHKLNGWTRELARVDLSLRLQFRCAGGS